MKWIRTFIVGSIVAGFLIVVPLYLVLLLLLKAMVSARWLRLEPTFYPLRGHPRFERLVTSSP